MRHIMTFDVETIPIAFGRCLCAIVNDNLSEKDTLLKPCMATIAELTLINPIISYKTGCIRALINNAVNVVLGTNFTSNMNDGRGGGGGGGRGNNHNVDFMGISGKLTNIELTSSNIILLEAILSAFLHLFNWPETRQLLLPKGGDFYVFIAPFTDTYSFLQASLAAKKMQLNGIPELVDGMEGGKNARPDMRNAFLQHGPGGGRGGDAGGGGGGGANQKGGNSSSFQCTLEERMLRYAACRHCLLSILRSWPGMFFMCRIAEDQWNDSVRQQVGRFRNNSNMPISEADYSEIYNQTNFIPLRSLQDSLKFFGIEGRLMPRKVTQLVSGVGKAINSNSRHTSSFFTATSYDSMTPIESLVGILHLPYPEVHKHILELIFDLFGLRLPKWQEQFSDCLLYVYFALLNKSGKHQTYGNSTSQSKDFYPNEWQLYDGFVAREGEHVLPPKGTNRLNFIVAYHGLLLQSLVEYGVIEALVSVVLDSDDMCCVNLATILIGELIHLSGKYLPASTYAHRCQSLPSLVAASVSNHKSRRSRALSAISNLHQIHELKKKTSQPASLFLEQQIFFCKASNGPRAGGTGGSWSQPGSMITYSRAHSASLNKSHDEMVANLIKGCSILKKNSFKEWNWWQIADVLRHPGEALKKLEEKETHRIFVRKLLDFYKPSCRKFSNIAKNAGSSSACDTSLYSAGKDRKDPIYVENPRQLAVVSTLFIDFLLTCDENKIYEFLEEFLLDLDTCIKAVAKTIPDRDDPVFLSSRIQSTLSHYYFLMIGRFTHTPLGRSWLERTQIHQYIIDLINLNQRTSEIHLKLLVSSLDYTDVHFSRTILSKILTSTSDAIRLYATQFLRILLRAEISNFTDWTVELLLFQLFDQNNSVALAALDILDEACSGDSFCLLKVISQRPTILHLGDAGIVFMARFVSHPAGLTYMRQTNLLDNELARWRETFCARYVRLAEDALNEIFSLHQRSEVGSYGRRSDRDRTSFWPNLKRVSMGLYALPHLYGQLAQTNKGVEILKKEGVLDKIIRRIRKGVKHFGGADRRPNRRRPNDADTLKMKAALWSIGHIMTSEEGIRLAIEKRKQIVEWIVILAKTSTVVSLRGTCFLVLCLVSCTKRGSNVLKRYGWVSIEHGPEDKFPINQQEYDNFYYDGRPRFMSDPERMRMSHDSLLGSDDNSSENDEDDDDDTSEDGRSKHIPDNKKDDKLPKHSTSSFNSSTSVDSNISSLGCLEMVPATVSNGQRNQRPRSSSDCLLQNDAGGGGGAKKPNGKSVVQLLSADQAAAGGADDRSRKTSAPCVTLTPDVTKGGRSDSNESGNTNNTAGYSSGIDSRTTSFADFSDNTTTSSTIVAKENANSAKAAATKAATAKNVDSDNKSQGSRSKKNKKVSLTTVHPQYQLNSLYLTDDPYPSPMDAHGYAQLRAIQKQRVQSLSMNTFITGVPSTPSELLSAHGAKSPTEMSRDTLLETISTLPEIAPGARQRKISNAIVQPILSFDSTSVTGSGYSILNASSESIDAEFITPRKLFQRSGSHISRRSTESSMPMAEEMLRHGESSNKTDFLCLALPEHLSNLFYLEEVKLFYLDVNNLCVFIIIICFAE